MSTIDIRDGLTIAVGDPSRGPRLTFEVSAADDLPPSATDPLGRRPSPAPEGERRDENKAPEPETTRIPAQPTTDTHPPEPKTTRIPAQPTTDTHPPDPQTTRIPAQPTVPEEPATGRMAIEPATRQIPAVPLEQMPIEPSPLERPTKPFRYVSTPPATPTPEAPPPVTADPQPKGVLARVAEGMRRPPETPGPTGPDELPPQTNRLPLQPDARTVGVAAYQLGLTVDGHEVLADISFTTRPGALIAVVGPSAARNFALSGLLAGGRVPSTGMLTVDGHDVYGEPGPYRSRIGAVPRDNRVQPNLSVENALRYAAELRLPPGTTVENRARFLEQILDELELTQHRKTRVSKLPPEVRRCAALAAELLARPTLLVVDEPGAGLEPRQESHVMGLLRRQADLGCVVIMAVTSPASLAHLNMCDQVLVLTPAGRLAFAGPPSHIEAALGSTDWREIFARITHDPNGAYNAFMNRQQASESPTPPSVTTVNRIPPALTFGQQFRMVARRQLRILATSPVYLLLLLLLPFALGALTLLIPGQFGFGRAAPSSTNTHQAIEILAAMNFAAVVMGTLATIGALVTERRVFRREQQLGLSATAYLLAKIAVFGIIAAAQAAVLTAIVIVGKGGPRHGAVLLGNADVELYVSVAATGVASAIVGLALSSVGRSLKEVLPLLVPALLASLLFAGGLVSLVGTWGYDQVSWFVPAQWGFAAAASTVDLRRADKLAEQNAVWTHYSGWWVFDMLVLAALAAAWAGFVRYRLRPRGTSQT
ncbi:ABC transporter permease [Mycobacterium vicinigordonae]|uniref:ABC transporter permease n=2 Tax=Mycobacterium vicinigordonae TaxID=1719132 RepID=A0A7D6E9K3_9MYCO|nr:ABC transporter permease [Mycobacterium vicinigordonae]